MSYGQLVPRSVFEAKTNSTLNLSQVALERINPELFGIGPAWVGAISGVNATLNMVRSSISQAAASVGAVVWSGGVANVVSSLISESGGLSVSDDTQPGVMNLVNSLVSVDAQNSDIQRLQSILGGELNITASSILQDVLYNTDHTSTTCNSDPYACSGKPLTAFDGGTITLKQSYVSLINAQDGLIPAGVPSYSNALYGPSNAGSLVALDSVWLQTTPNQSAADLQSLFGNAPARGLDALQRIRATTAELHQLQRSGAGAANAVMEANPPGCIDLPDLVGPQQMADPQPPVV